MDHTITFAHAATTSYAYAIAQITKIDLLSLILAIIVGWVAGILINYLADVLPLTRRLTRPLCPECNQPYGIKDYLFRFRCANCGRRRSIRSIIVLVCAVFSCVLLRFFPFSILRFWATLPILIFLGVIMVIDIEHRIVVIETSLLGMVLFSIYGIILWGFLRTLLGALAGLLTMLVFYFTGIVFSKIVGKLKHREISEVAFGFGDVFAGTFLGLLAGWPAIIGVVILAIIAFGAVSFVFVIVLLISQRYRAFTNALPFTPFLIFGVISFFYLIMF